ncbi:MAG TPA: ABC transporter permease [Terriglobales bacterium]|nr:ABC transporter permease [Terriglobales bacterium]
MRALFDTLGQIFRTLWAHKLRSFLTMFGIAWGVGSLLLLVGLGEGFRTGNRRQLDQIGENIMFIFPGRTPAIPGNPNSGRLYKLTYQDYRDIVRDCPDVLAATPLLSRQDLRAVSEWNSANGQVIGSEPQFRGIRYLPLKQGRWLTSQDEGDRRNVAVLGSEVAKNLYPGHPALGTFMLLNGLRFEIVGILDQVGRGDNNSTNQRIYIPYSTMATYFPLTGEGDVGALSSINYTPRSRDAHLIARDQVRRVVARNHGFDYHNEDAFDEWDTIRSAQMVGKIFDAMNMFLGSVGLVTLALGAIGIINIMLVSVSERTREIGLRKALGATNRSILFQFFMEGVLLTLVSGGIGMAFAAGVMAALGKLPSPPGFDTPKLVASSASLAILSLSLAGIVAGLYPARKAAMLTPVEALRSE